MLRRPRLRTRRRISERSPIERFRFCQPPFFRMEPDLHADKIVTVPADQLLSMRRALRYRFSASSVSEIARIGLPGFGRGSGQDHRDPRGAETFFAVQIDDLRYGGWLDSAPRRVYRPWCRWRRRALGESSGVRLRYVGYASIQKLARGESDRRGRYWGRWNRWNKPTTKSAGPFAVGFGSGLLW